MRTILGSNITDKGDIHRKMNTKIEEALDQAV